MLTSLIVCCQFLKRTHLHKITNLFSEFNLSPYSYHIDKCHVVNRTNNSKNFEMGCASITFLLEKK